MPQHIVIVGGVGGKIVANLLARLLHLQETKVTLIENTGKHAYMRPIIGPLPSKQVVLLYTACNDRLLVS